VSKLNWVATCLKGPLECGWSCYVVDIVATITELPNWNWLATIRRDGVDVCHKELSTSPTAKNWAENQIAILLGESPAPSVPEGMVMVPRAALEQIRGNAGRGLSGEYHPLDSLSMTQADITAILDFAQ
jgi:hypothetical protein